MPSYVTNENVHFNGTTTPSVVVRDDGTVKHLITWDNLSAGERGLLDAVIQDHGGVTPIATPVSGYAVLNFGGGVVGTASTGLSTTTTATAGKATIDLNGTAVAGNPSGLSTASGTSGYQIVNYQPGVTASTATGIPAPTAGYQVINFSATKVGTSRTGIPNDSTVRTATITVDGVAKTVTVAGSAVQTFSALITAINSALGASGSAAVVNGDIKITSATTGTSSTVVANTGTLFTVMDDFNVISASVKGKGSTVALTATITVDGVAKAVSVAPGSAATFGAVVAAINGALGASGTAAIVGGDIRVTSSSFGVASKVSIDPGTLFPILTGFSGVLPAEPGGGAARPYGFTVFVDGTKIKTVSFTGKQGNKFSDVITEINADLGADATAAIEGGNIVITSATTGARSSVSIYDNGFLASSLLGFVRVVSVVGVAPVVYTLDLLVDGTVKHLTVTGSDAATYASVVASINTQLGAAGSASIVTGDIKVASASTGVASTVSVTGGSLLTSLPLYRKQVRKVSGAADMLDVLSVVKSPAGVPLLQVFNIRVVGEKPPVPTNVKHTLAYTYYDGTAWKYLDDDTAV